jgi:hypothetical protein
MLKRIWLLAAVLAVLAAPAQAGGGKQDKIRQLIALDGAEAVVEQVIARRLPVVREKFQADHPKASQATVDAYGEAFAAELRARRGQFVDLIVPVYDEIFTDAEIDALLAFNTSPAGRKLRAVTEDILIGAREAGRTWGRQHGGDVTAAALAKVKAAGHKVD